MDKAKKARIEAQLSRMIKENLKSTSPAPGLRDSLPTRPSAAAGHVIRRRKGNPEERIPSPA